MRIVFIACFFPPMNSTGARRVTAFSRNLAAMGHDVVVVTPTKRPVHGELTEQFPEGVRVLELPVPSPAPVATPAPGVPPAPTPAAQPSLLRRGRKWLGRISVRLFGQLVERDLIFVKDVLKDPRVGAEFALADVVVSTSPPWITHLAARLLARRHGTPWIADYRDQFSNTHLMRTSAFARRVETFVDRWLVRANQGTVVVSPAMQDYYSRWDRNTQLIYNGFEPEGVEDARLWASANPTPAERPFTLRYLGSYIADLPPRELLAALREFAKASDFRLEIIGAGSEAVHEHVAELAPEIADKVASRPKVDADQALRLMASADCLVLLETWRRDSSAQRGVATTKVFEYIASGKPVIAAVSPEIVAVRIVREAGLLAAGSLEVGDLAQGLVRAAARGGSSFCADPDVVNTYSRTGQAEQLERLMRQVMQAGDDAIPPSR